MQRSRDMKNIKRPVSTRQSMGDRKSLRFGNNYG
jgi:hypothetical protein